MSTSHKVVREVRQDGLDNIYQMLYHISYSLYKLDDMPNSRVWRKISRSRKPSHPPIQGWCWCFLQLTFSHQGFVRWFAALCLLRYALANARCFLHGRQANITSSYTRLVLAFSFREALGLFTPRLAALCVLRCSTLIGRSQLFWLPWPVDVDLWSISASWRNPLGRNANGSNCVGESNGPDVNRALFWLFWTDRIFRPLECCGVMSVSSSLSLFNVVMVLLCCSFSHNASRAHASQTAWCISAEEQNFEFWRMITLILSNMAQSPGFEKVVDIFSR